MKIKTLAAVLLLALAPLARATTLDTLDHGVGTLSAGNATYSNFSYGGTTLDSTVTVTASASGPTSTLTFARTAGTWTLTDGNSVVNYHIAFATPITSMGLDFIASATGGAVSSVGETVTDGVTHITYTPTMQVVTGIGPPTLSTTFNFSTPVSSLDIVKSIDTAGTPGAGVSATITSVDNTYTVPEPASLSLLAFAALPILRRRTKAGVRRR